MYYIILYTVLVHLWRKISKYFWCRRWEFVIIIGEKTAFGIEIEKELLQNFSAAAL